MAGIMPHRDRRGKRHAAPAPTDGVRLQDERPGPDQVRQARPLLGLEQRVHAGERLRDGRLQPLRALRPFPRHLVRLRDVEDVGREGRRPRAKRAAIIDRALDITDAAVTG